MIFVDTGAWFATFVPNDPDHAAADAWLQANVQPLVTTDYVIDELLTLLKIRGEFQWSISPRRENTCSTQILEMMVEVMLIRS